MVWGNLATVYLQKSDHEKSEKLLLELLYVHKLNIEKSDYYKSWIDEVNSKIGADHSTIFVPLQ